MPSPSRLVALVLLLVVLTAAIGCRGVSPSAPGGASSAQTAPVRTATGGPAIFAAACVVCHSLSGRAAPSQQGGDLRDYRLSLPELESLTRGMPVRPPLTAAEVSTVSAYLLSVERRPKAAVH